MQNRRHICPHLVQWEPECRILCKQTFPDQESLLRHRAEWHEYKSHQNRAAHPWTEDQDAPLRVAKLLGHHVGELQEELEADDDDNDDNDDEMEEKEVLESILECEHDEERTTSEEHLVHDRQDLRVLVARQNLDHQPQIHGDASHNPIDGTVLENFDCLPFEFQDLVDPLPFPDSVPQVLEALVAANNNYFDNSEVPQTALPSDISPLVPNDEVARYIAAYEFAVSYANQNSGLVEDANHVDGFSQQAQYIGNLGPVEDDILARANYQQDINAGSARQGMLPTLPLADYALANGGPYGDLQLGPLAVVPYPLPHAGRLNVQSLLATVAQPGFASNAFATASHPSPYSAALIMLALARPNLGIEALPEDQAVDITVRLRRTNYPLALQLPLDSATDNAHPGGVEARILRTDFVNDNAQFSA